MNNAASLNRVTINGWLGDITVRSQVIAYAQSIHTIGGRVVRYNVGDHKAEAKLGTRGGSSWTRAPFAANALADATVSVTTHRWIKFAQTVVAEAAAGITAYAKPPTDVFSPVRVFAFAQPDISPSTFCAGRVYPVAFASADITAYVKPPTPVRDYQTVSASATAALRFTRWGRLSPVATAYATATVAPKRRIRVAGSFDAHAYGVVNDSIFRQIPWDEPAPLDRKYIVFAEQRLFFVRGNMPIVAKVKQQPRDVQDYDITFDEWFPSGDLIATVAMNCEPPVPTPPTYAIDPSKRIVKVWFYAGAEHGVNYKVTVRATATNDGNPMSPVLRVKEAELIVKVREV